MVFYLNEERKMLWEFQANIHGVKLENQEESSISENEVPGGAFLPLEKYEHMSPEEKAKKTEQMMTAHQKWHQNIKGI